MARFTEMLKKGWVFIVFGAVIIVFLLATKDDKLSEQQPEFSSQAAGDDFEDDTDNFIEADEQTAAAVVDVKGEVADPGVYEMDTDARVNDVIDDAGGFTGEADETFVNLAEKVQDEMIIHVPKTGEIDAEGGPADTENSKIRLNYANQEEIEKLSGIGPSKAEAIIQYREENGFFQSSDDLLEISGIGEKTLEVIADELQIP